MRVCWLGRGDNSRLCANVLVIEEGEKLYARVYL